MGHWWWQVLFWLVKRGRLTWPHLITSSRLACTEPLDVHRFPIALVWITTFALDVSPPSLGCGCKSQHLLKGSNVFKCHNLWWCKTSFQNHHTTRKMPAEWLWQKPQNWRILNTTRWTMNRSICTSTRIQFETIVHCTHWYSFNLCRKLLTRTVATPFFKTSSHAQISEIPTFGAAIGRQDILMASESQVYSEAPMATKRAQTSSCPPPFQDRMPPMPLIWSIHNSPA